MICFIQVLLSMFDEGKCNLLPSKLIAFLKSFAYSSECLSRSLGAIFHPTPENSGQLMAKSALSDRSFQKRDVTYHQSPVTCSMQIMQSSTQSIRRQSMRARENSCSTPLSSRSVESWCCLRVESGVLLPILPCTCREEEACEQNDPIRGGGTQIEILKMKVDWNVRRNEKGCNYGTQEIEEN